MIAAVSVSAGHIYSSELIARCFALERVCLQAVETEARTVSATVIRRATQARAAIAVPVSHAESSKPPAAGCHTSMRSAISMQQHGSSVMRCQNY
jgi:hypothetical protein